MNLDGADKQGKSREALFAPRHSSRRLLRKAELRTGIANCSPAVDIFHD
jgi:hypothetical protein